MIKSSIHRVLNAFGVDIVRSGQLEQELNRREQARQQARILELDRLRAQEKVFSGGAGAVRWVDRVALMEEAVRLMRPADSVLDIGCAFRPQQYITARTHICCEPFHEYMHRLMVETAGDARFVYLKADAAAASELLPDKSVDTVFMSDVIEHIDRPVAEKALERLQRIARSQIILFTPLGYMDQDPDDGGRDQWGMGGMEWQKHRSGWTPDDFPPTAGWSVVACKDLHQNDGYERPMSKPVGAFWAIWNSVP